MGEHDDPGGRPISGHGVRAIVDAQSVMHEAVQAALQAEHARLCEDKAVLRQMVEDARDLAAEAVDLAAEALDVPAGYARHITHLRQKLAALRAA